MKRFRHQRRNKRHRERARSIMRRAARKLREDLIRWLDWRVLGGEQ